MERNMTDLFECLKNMPYPGRGLFLGRTEDGTKALILYFLTGRSENSRNRVFVPEGDGIRTEAFDPSKMVDPSLIIYAPVKVYGNKTIVTNGDQTDTIFQGFEVGASFEESLSTRTFEPDAPNYTPRISAVLEVNGGMKYEMSAIRTVGGDPEHGVHDLYRYQDPKAGEGHFLRTYLGKGSPLPSYEGDPLLCTTIGWSCDPDELIDDIWASLDLENKVSLFLRVIDLTDGSWTDRIRNKLGN